MKNMIKTLLLVATSLILSAVAYANQYYQMGQNALSMQNIPLANDMFAKAFEQEPSDDVRIMYAMTKMLTTLQNESFMSLLRNAGVEIESSNLYTFDASFELLSDITQMNKTWNMQEDKEFVQNVILPELVSVLDILNGISPSMKDIPIETKKMSIAGFELDDDIKTVFVDYADVLFLKALTSAAVSQLKILSNYNLNATPAEVLKFDLKFLSAQSVTSIFPNLAVKEGSDFSDVKKLASEAIVLLEESINKAKFRKFAESNLFIIEEETLDYIKAYINRAKDSINGPTLVVAASENPLMRDFKLNLNPYLSGNIEPRKMLPYFAGNKIVNGSIPDYTFGGLFSDFTAEDFNEIIAEFEGNEILFTDRNKTEYTSKYPLLNFGITCKIYNHSYDFANQRMLIDTDAPLVASDNNGVRDVYLIDLKTGSKKLLSTKANSNEPLALGGYLPQKSEDYNYLPTFAIGGNYATFLSNDPTLDSSLAVINYKKTTGLPTGRIGEYWNDPRDDDNKFTTSINLSSYLGYKKIKRLRYKITVELEKPVDCNMHGDVYIGDYSSWFECYDFYDSGEKALATVNGKELTIEGYVSNKINLKDSFDVKVHFYDTWGYNSEFKVKSIEFISEAIPNVFLYNIKTATLENNWEVSINRDDQDYISRRMNYGTCALSPDGKHLFFGYGDHNYDMNYSYWLYNTERKSEISFDVGVYSGDCIYFAGNGKRAFYVDCGDCDLVIDLTSYGQYPVYRSYDTAFLGTDYEGKKVLYTDRDEEQRIEGEYDYGWGYVEHYDFSPVRLFVKDISVLSHDSEYTTTKIDLPIGLDLTLESLMWGYYGEEYLHPLATISPDGKRVFFAKAKSDKEPEISKASWVLYDISKNNVIENYGKLNWPYPNGEGESLVLENTGIHFVDESNISVFGNVSFMFANSPVVQSSDFALIDIYQSANAAYFKNNMVSVAENATSVSVPVMNASKGEYAFVCRDVCVPEKSTILKKTLSGGSSSVSVSLPSLSENSVGLYSIDMIPVSGNASIGVSPTMFVRKGDPIVNSITITNYPKNASVQKGSTVTFATQATSKLGNVSYYWERSFDGENWSGAGSSSDSLTIPNVEKSFNGTQYRCTLMSGADKKYVSATLNVISLNDSCKINEKFEDVPVGSNVKFTTSSTSASSYLWQVDIDGTGWIDIKDATQSYLDLGKASSVISGNKYRCVVTTLSGNKVVSNESEVTVDCSSATWYVSPNGNDSNTGKSWSRAFKTLSAAIKACGNSGGVIRMFKGEYKISEDYYKFENVNVTIQGGYSGTEADASERDPANKTRIYNGLNFDNSIVKIDAVSFVPYGYDIASGSTLSDPSGNGGGRIDCTDSCIVVSNCSFFYHVYTAISLTQTDNSGSLIVSNCTFKGNSIYCSDDSENGDLYVNIRNSTFVNPYPELVSNSMQFFRSEVEVVNCTLYSSPVDVDYDFYPIYSEFSDLKVVNTIFWDNKADDVKFEIQTEAKEYYDDSTDEYFRIYENETQFINCVIKGHHTDYRGYYDNSTGTWYEDEYVYYLWNMEWEDGVEFIRVTDQDPLLKNLADNGGFVETIALENGSWAGSAGLSSLAAKEFDVSLPSYDARGQKRSATAMSLGAYESTSGPVFDIDLESSISIYESKSVELVVSASTSTGDSISYEWYVNKNDNKGFVSVATGEKYSFTPTKSYNGYKYKCVATSNGFETESNIVTLTVRETAKITSQPQQSVTVGEGHSTELKVSASGYNLKYQWEYYNGSKWIALEGETSNVLKLEHVGADENNAQYRCKVSNGGANVVTSATTKISVVEAPKITQHPNNVVVESGGSAKFTVKATGKKLKYQWQLKLYNDDKWTNIPKATKATLSLSKLEKKSFNGNLYRCIVSNANGMSDYSDEALLTVNQKTTLSTTIKSVTIFKEDSKKLSVNVNAEPNVKVLWEIKYKGSKKWNSFSSSEENRDNFVATLDVDGKTEYNGAKIRCRVSGNEGAYINSAEMSVVVCDKTEVSFDKKHTPEAFVGTSATFVIKGKGYGKITYQWYKNGVKINKATKATYKTPTLTTKDFDDVYDCKVSNPAGDVWLSECVGSAITIKRLYPTEVLSITPNHNVAYSTGTVEFTAKVSDKAGSTKINYKWQVCAPGLSTSVEKNWKNAGSSKPTLVIKKPKINLNGATYRCLVWNAVNKANPNGKNIYATLEVRAAAVVKTQPKAVKTYEGNSTTISIKAEGYRTQYQWERYDSVMKKWVDVKDEKSNTITFVADSRYTKYRCKVWSDGMEAKAVTSKEAKLTVQDKVEDVSISVVQQKQYLQIDSLGDVSALSDYPLELKVSARYGKSLKYQWYDSEDDGRTWRAIKKATKASYKIKKPITEIDGKMSYYCKVYNGDITNDNSSNGTHEDSRKITIYITDVLSVLANEL